MTNEEQTEVETQQTLNGVDIPPCPRILIDLKRELDKDPNDIREISLLVSQDVALSGHIMQIANSPAFSTGSKVISVIQALSVLGTESFFKLVVWQLFKRSVATQPSVNLDWYWESAATTGRICAELAKRFRCMRADVAYTYGLLHDCGIPLLSRRFPTNINQVLREAARCADKPFSDVENAHFHTNHSVIGYYLAKRWKLSDEIANAIKYHHRYEVITDKDLLSQDSRTLIALCALAEEIESHYTRQKPTTEWSKCSSVVCTYLGLSLGSVDDLVEELCDWL